MKLFFGILCFFLAAYFLAIAFKNPYSHSKLAHQMQMADPPYFFFVRFIVAALLVFLGIKLV